MIFRRHPLADSRLCMLLVPLPLVRCTSSLERSFKQTCQVVSTPGPDSQTYMQTCKHRPANITCNAFCEQLQRNTGAQRGMEQETQRTFNNKTTQRASSQQARSTRQPRILLIARFLPMQCGTIKTANIFFERSFANRGLKFRWPARMTFFSPRFSGRS